LESFWHQVQIILLADVVNVRYDDRQDFFAGGNMFIYFNVEQARNRDFRGPDFFFVSGVNRLPVRKWWAVWDEGGRYPDLIIELLSETTAKMDRTTKKELYERTFRTPEYYCFDPETKRLEGWRLNAKLRYQPLKPNDKGWLWSEELDCWLGTGDGTYAGVPGTWLRFFDKQGRLLPTKAELETARWQSAEAEVARLKAKLTELEKKK
jgi:Uma2 family endonuclease